MPVYLVDLTSQVNRFSLLYGHLCENFGKMADVYLSYIHKRPQGATGRSHLSVEQVRLSNAA